MALVIISGHVTMLLMPRSTFRRKTECKDKQISAAEARLSGASSAIAAQLQQLQ